MNIPEEMKVKLAHIAINLLFGLALALAFALALAQAR